LYTVVKALFKDDTPTRFRKAHNAFELAAASAPRERLTRAVRPNAYRHAAWMVVDSRADDPWRGYECERPQVPTNPSWERWMDDVG
jgi:uncharacterized protein (DUF58 family)